jgi:hypothetical protein
MDPDPSSSQHGHAHAHNEQLMGNRPGQLNLRATRARAMELGAVVDEIIYLLRVAPQSLRWNDVVDKMAVMNVQLQQLQDELRPVCHHYALHPKSVNAYNSATLPVMLATMLYPEQQNLCDQVVKETSARGGYEGWKTLVDGVCGGTGRRRARRRAAVTGGQATVPPLDDAEQELLNIVSFGGLPT